VARDIAALLESDKRLLNNQISGSKKITPKDIAVLVRTNEQTQQIQTALKVLADELNKVLDEPTDTISELHEEQID